MVLTVPVLSQIRSHADEHQFHFNAFSIMAGEELHNYLHVAFTEYALAGFFTFVNLFTDSGVNFPQGGPSLVTLYYGKIFGFGLYLITFILAVMVLQGRERSIKGKTVVFAALYFSSLGIFERFLRVNSDSMILFVFLNFIIWSFWLHKRKVGIIKFLLFNIFSTFLISFTNLKGLYLVLPVLAINIIVPFLRYGKDAKEGTLLPKLYSIILYAFGFFSGILFLWSVFVPKPFNHIKFWYGIKKTIVHGTKFDFDYPSQSYGSWKVYIYDFFAEYLGLITLAAILVLISIAFKYKGKSLLLNLIAKVKKQLNLSFLWDGDLYSKTEIILFLCLLSYYFGVATRIVHWSRWGVPIGLLGFMVMSSFIYELIVVVLSKVKHFRYKFSIVLLLFVAVWFLRVLLTVDLRRTNYPEKGGWGVTYTDVENFMSEKGIDPLDGPKKIAWFNGYTYNVKSFSLELITDPANQEVEYILWPYWHISALYADNRVDKTLHNIRAFVDKYVESTEYRYPGLLTYYMHGTKYFAGKYLGITWNPELDSLLESQYGVTKLKGPIKDIRLIYPVSFDEMSHYYFPYSLLYNMKELKDSYMYPPCYSYPDARFVKDNEKVMPPSEIGVGARTAGLYCHSTRFWYLFKGIYRIRIENLPDDPDGVQKVFSNLAIDWDPETKTILLDVTETRIVGDFGVATAEKYLPDLKFTVFYKSE
ncbi:MAG: hypothetical protein ABIB98_03545 [bacterium]